MAKFRGPSATSIVMVLVFAIAMIYLWSQFTDKGTCTAADVTSKLHGCANAGDSYTIIFPSGFENQLEPSTMWIVRLIILGVAVLLGWVVVSKFLGGHFGRKDFITLVLLAVAVWFVWDKILVPSNILSADTFAEITWKTAMKLGLAP